MALSDVIKTGSGIPTSGAMITGGIAIDNVNKKIYTKDSTGAVVDLVVDGFDNTLVDRVAEFTNKTIADFSNHVHADAMHFQVLNQSGANIVRGQALAFDSANSNGDNMYVKAANGTTDIAIGIADSDMLDDTFGDMITLGVLKNINTAAYSQGQILYVSTGGILSSVDPKNAVSQPIAFVLRSHSVSGSLLISAQYPKQIALDVPYTNTTSGLTATTVQAAIDEVEGRVDTIESTAVAWGDVTGTLSNQTDLQTALDGKSDTTHNHDGTYEPADATILKDADIGVTVQGYSADTVIDAAYVHTDNNYTTAEVTKLAGIEAGATADQTKADIDALGIAASTAATLATTRTISISGDATGSTTFNGSANVDIVLTIADDSHSHTIANIDGLDTALTGKLDTTANAVSASKWNTARTITLSGDLSGSVIVDGSANVTLTGSVLDDSHNHIISNVDGLQTALDGKSSTSHTHAGVYEPADANIIKTTSTATITGVLTFKEYKETVYEDAAAPTTLSIDPINGTIQTATLTGDTTIDFTNLEAGQSVLLHVINPSSYVVTYSGVTWVGAEGNVAPDLTTHDVFTFWKIGSTVYVGYVGNPL